MPGTFQKWNVLKGSQIQSFDVVADPFQNISVRSIRLTMSVLGALPLSLRILLGRILGSLFSLLPTRDRTVAALQMNYFLPECGARKHLGKMYAGLGQSVFECLNLTPYIQHLERYISCNDEALLEEYLNSKQGILVLSAHTGNWDLLAAYLIKKGLRLTVIGREARQPILQQLLSTIREGYGVETIWRSDTAAAFKIMKKLRRGEVVASLLDQDTDVPSRFIPFFGTPARTPSSIVEMAKRVQARIMPLFIFRTGFCRYHVRLHEIKNTLEVEEILTEFNRLLEQHIREFPSQWVWVHKRWRSVPDGRKLSSREYIAYLIELKQRG